MTDALKPVITLPGGTLRFTVRYWPEDREVRWPPRTNNLDLSAEGVVEISAARMTLLSSDGKTHVFERPDIARVERSPTEAKVFLQTTYDERFVTVWLQSPEQADQFVSLLGSVVAMHQEHERRFEALSRESAPYQWVTPTLVSVNVLVFVILVLAGAGVISPDTDVHAKFGSNLGPVTWGGEYWRLLSGAFIHFGVVHLGLNMYALWTGGRLIEKLYGSSRFLVIYLLSAVAGSTVSGWWQLDRNSAGSSGALFGVYGALLVFFALRRSDVPVTVLKFSGNGAAALLINSLLLGTYLPFIDNAAHVGGLLAGSFAGLLLVRPFMPEARSRSQPIRVAFAAMLVCAALAALSWPLWGR